MRFLPTCAVLLSLCTAVPAFGQNAMLVAGSSASPSASASNTTTSSSATRTAPVDLTSFRDSIAQKNKKLTDQVAAEKNVVRKNEVILQEAKKIDAANKKLIAQRKLLEAQNAALDKERQAMQEEQKASDSPAVSQTAGN